MNTSSPLINYPCTVCCKPTSMWCSRCQNAWYCTADHLNSDWPRHRRECVAVSTSQQQYNMIATPPPAVPQITAVTAIYFAPEEGAFGNRSAIARPVAPVGRVSVSHRIRAVPRPPLPSHTDRPRIITVNCQPPQTPTQGSCPTPLLQEFFPSGQVNSVVLTQGLNGEPLRFPLHVFYSPLSLSSGSPINRAIYRITSGAAARPWCGPVIVLKYNGSRRQGYADAGSNDLPALSAYFLAYK
ncbi:hypothetical protein OF83DRAFT_219208 [Amylostereum chailletii]|nr:hypothetical protein OF83DRAFT_219208 [Amylostereum chailletii]